MPCLPMRAHKLGVECDGFQPLSVAVSTIPVVEPVVTRVRILFLICSSAGKAPGVCRTRIGGGYDQCCVWRYLRCCSPPERRRRRIHGRMRQGGWIFTFCRCPGRRRFVPRLLSGTPALRRRMCNAGHDPIPSSSLGCGRNMMTASRNIVGFLRRGFITASFPRCSI